MRFALAQTYGSAVSDVLVMPKTKSLGLIVFVVLATLFAQGVLAFTAPVAGDFLFDLYDIGVTQGISGAPGMLGGILLIGYAGTQMGKSWPAAGMSGLGGTMLLNAETIVTSMGLTVI